MSRLLVVVGILAVFAMMASTPSVSWPEPPGAVLRVVEPVSMSDGSVSPPDISDAPPKVEPIVVDATTELIRRCERNPDKACRDMKQERLDRIERREKRKAEQDAARDVPLNNVDGTWTHYGVAHLAHQAGFRGEELAIMTAVVRGESGGRAEVLGDTTIQTGKWGPSVGLSQTRSLRVDDHTGRTRDRYALVDPAFNLRSAYTIARQADALGWGPFQPWSVYTSGKYLQWIDEAREAAALATEVLGE